MCCFLRGGFAVLLSITPCSASSEASEEEMEKGEEERGRKEDVVLVVGGFHDSVAVNSRYGSMDFPILEREMSWVVVVVHGSEGPPTPPAFTVVDDTSGEGDGVLPTVISSIHNTACGG